jgi:hypothetical protein
VLLELADNSLHRDQDAEHLPEDPHMSLTERRIASLAPYAMPMNMNVPPPAAGQSWTERSNANYLQQQAAKAARKEGRADQHRHLLAVGHGEAEPGSGPSSFGDSRRGGRRLVIGERRAMRAQESGRGSRLGERRVETSNLQDDQKTEDVLWVVLLNIEQGESLFTVIGRILTKPCHRPAHRVASWGVDSMFIIYRKDIHHSKIRKTIQSSACSRDLFLYLHRVRIPARHLLVSLHNGVGDERGGDLLAAKPAAVEAGDGLLGGVNRVELHIDLSL